nr:glutathionine S-transferase [Klebsiella pneumoniae]
MGTGRAAAALSDSPLSAGENDAGAGGAEKIHPLGKSPVLEDNGYVLAESGAILEYLQETWDSGGLLKPQGIDDKLQYRFWLHYAEGSLMPLLLMKLVFASLGKPCALWRSLAGFAAGQGIQKTWLDPQLATHARFIDDHLAARPWFAGERLSMADIQMSFPVMALLARGGMHDLVHIEAWRQRVEQRPAGNAPSSAAALHLTRRLRYQRIR